jgi:cytochrome c biogenesis protein CcmG/thiol:disulfide interchange protein DsbE
MTEQTHPAAAVNTMPSEESGPQGIAWGRMVIWILIFGLLGLLGWGLINSGLSQPTAGPAPDFTITTYTTDEEIHLADLRGQVVVVNFWASWCVPCIDEAPDLEATWQAYKNQGVMFVGIDYLDSERKGLEFLAEHGITYANGPDLQQKISDDYRITGVPETFVINPEGDITFHAALPITQSQLSLEIDKAMQ